MPRSGQIAAQLRAKIEAGEYSPDVALPSIEKLADEYEVATGTVQRALKILKDDGVVESVPGYGTFITQR